jgi:7-carboxy-7-deazaguanine synthase
MLVRERLVTLCGETALAGTPCALIRFSGCSLRCSWCDTGYAYAGGEETSVAELLRWAERSGPTLVLLTGGEPLLQAELPQLATELAARGLTVLVETNGAHDISPLEPPVLRAVDIKCPASGEAAANRWQNLADLRAGDTVKLVVADRADYDYARAVVREHRLGPPLDIFFTAAAPLAAEDLARWILDDRLSHVRLGAQLHKLLWPRLEPRPEP